jgi:hypothetical protein
LVHYVPPVARWVYTELIAEYSKRRYSQLADYIVAGVLKRQVHLGATDYRMCIDEAFIDARGTRGGRFSRATS